MFRRYKPRATNALPTATTFGAIDCNGTTTSINCGNDTGLRDLPLGAVTVEGWFRPDTKGENSYGTLWRKANFLCVMNNGPQLNTFIDYEIGETDAAVQANLRRSYGQWMHVALTYSQAGDRKIRVYLDGVLSATSPASSGDLVSDAAGNFYLGNKDDGSRCFDGGIGGWFRVSNTVRYTEFFVPNGPDTPPAVDGNTLLQYNFTEGEGTALDNVESTAGRDGTISNGSWLEVAWYW